MNNQRQTLTIEEAARRIGIGRSLAYELARRGEIPVRRLGRVPGPSSRPRGVALRDWGGGVSPQEALTSDASRW